jgi:non-specific serine/threonine protein kinase
MNRLKLISLAAFLLAAGCAFGPRPQPQPPDYSREKAIRGRDHFENGRLDRAERDFKSAFYLDQAEDRPAALARDHHNLAALFARQGDHATAREHLLRAIDIQRAAGDSPALARSLAALAAVEEAGGNPDAAAPLLEEALRLVPEAGPARLYVLNVKGAHLTQAGDVAGAEAALREAMELGGLEGTDVRLAAATLHYLGRAALAKGELERAKRLLEEAHRLDREGQYPAGIAADLEQLAAVEAAAGRLPEAFRLWEKAFNIYVYLKDTRRAKVVLAELERRHAEAKLGEDVNRSLGRLKEALGGLEAAGIKPAAADYSLGSKSTTQ